MKKFDFTISDLFSASAVCGLWLFYRSEIIQRADGLFMSVFGKGLTGRNPAVRIAVLGGAFLVCILIPLLLERLIRKDPKYSRLTTAASMMILAVPAVQLLVICANQVLRRDDYWEIADARTYGFPGSMIYEIRQWNGRYTGWGLRSLHAVLPDIPYIDIFLFVTLILLTVGNTMLAYRFLRSQFPGGTPGTGQKPQAVLIGFGLSISFILMSSNIWEFWFWGSGTMIYGFGMAMCILSTALVLNASENASAGKMILPAFTCFLTCGCSELCTASLAAFLFIILIWKRIRTKTWNIRIIFFFAEICILFLCILLASGTLNYAGTWELPENSGSNASPGWPDRIRGIVSWAFSGLYGYTFIRSRELLLILGTALLIGTRLKFDRPGCIKLLIIAGLLTVIAHCVLMINSMLNYMPPRVITVGICWFVTALALVCVLLGSLITRGKPLWNGQIKMVFCALLLALMINRFYSENIRDARQIRESWYIRNYLLEQYAGTDEPVKTCSLPSPGSSRDDILKDPEDEFNKAAALFYQIPAISADLRCPPYGESFVTPDLYDPR